MRGTSSAAAATTAAASLQPVATRSIFPTQAPKTDKVLESYSTQHTMTTTASDVRPVFGNILFGAVGGGESEVDASTPITVRASVVLPGGPAGDLHVPLYFDGARSVTIEPDGFAVPDPTGITLPAGVSFTVRTAINVPTLGNGIPRGIGLRSSGDTAAGSFNYPNVIGTDEGYADDIDNTYPKGAASFFGPQYGFSPVVIVGVPRVAVPAVALCGDSIISGGGESPAIDAGFAVRALNRQFGYLHMGKGSEKALDFAAAGRSFRRRRLLAYGITHAIVLYGTNDLANAATTAQTRDRLVGCWLHLYRAKVKVHACTIPPNTNSSDSWATTGNQTPRYTNANRTDVNDWIRDGAPIDATSLASVAVGTAGALRMGAVGHPLRGYFETADKVESARNSGLWAPGLTGDGTHPNNAGHAAMQAAIDTGVIRL